MFFTQFWKILLHPLSPNRWNQYQNNVPVLNAWLENAWSNQAWALCLVLGSNFASMFSLKAAAVRAYLSSAQPCGGLALPPKVLGTRPFLSKSLTVEEEASAGAASPVSVLAFLDRDELLAAGLFMAGCAFLFSVPGGEVQEAEEVFGGDGGAGGRPKASGTPGGRGCMISSMPMGRFLPVALARGAALALAFPFPFALAAALDLALALALATALAFAFAVALALALPFALGFPPAFFSPFPFPFFSCLAFAFASAVNFH